MSRLCWYWCIGCLCGILLCVAPAFGTPPAVTPTAPATTPAPPANRPSSGLVPEDKVPVFSHPAETQSAQAPKQITAWDIMNRVLKLILVLLFIYGVLVALKKMQQGKWRLPLLGNASFLPQMRTMQVLETTSLGQGRSMHLVAVGSRRFLIGSSSQQVTLLTDVTDACPAEPDSTEAPSFHAALTVAAGQADAGEKR